MNACVRTCACCVRVSASAHAISFTKSSKWTSLVISSYKNHYTPSNILVVSLCQSNTHNIDLLKLRETVREIELFGANLGILEDARVRGRVKVIVFFEI